jgi:hypothetical protein
MRYITRQDSQLSTRQQEMMGTMSRKSSSPLYRNQETPTSRTGQVPRIQIQGWQATHHPSTTNTDSQLERNSTNSNEIDPTSKETSNKNANWQESTQATTDTDQTTPRTVTPIGTATI